jgi:hypothetical protein
MSKEDENPSSPDHLQGVLESGVLMRPSLNSRLIAPSCRWTIAIYPRMAWWLLVLLTIYQISAIFKMMRVIINRHLFLTLALWSIWIIEWVSGRGFVVESC